MKGEIRRRRTVGRALEGDAAIVGEKREEICGHVP
jgi:hypothetical protein